MSDTSNSDTEQAAKKSSKLPLFLGIVLAIALGGGGFFGVSMLGSSPEVAGESQMSEPEKSTDAIVQSRFIPIPAMVVSLGQAPDKQHLKFSAHLEVPEQNAGQVERLVPRVSDALNTFLQALETADIANRDALFRLRVQMLHRVRLVVGDTEIKDLLISEFVLN